LARYKSPEQITGKDVVEWAVTGDSLASEIVQQSGTYLGVGLAILIDVLNPEIILVGGMGMRLGDLLLEPARAVIARESLPGAAAACAVVPAGLGERIGDLAALCVALYGKVQAG
ncbi:MAG: ROK family protein, partial [Fidelibacterota bacterium]